MSGVRKLYKFCIVSIICAGFLVMLYFAVTLKAINVNFAKVSHEDSVSDKHTINDTLIKENKTCFKLYWNYSNEDFLSSMDVHQSVAGKCFRFLTIETVYGRLGNQMFQLASLFGLAWEYDFIPLVPASTTLIKKYFDIPNMVDENRMPSIKFKVKCVGEKFAVYYNCSNEFHDTNQRGMGVLREKFLQSWKYFHKCKQMVRDIFKLKEEYIKNAKTFMESLWLNGSISVCIHVRRNDTLSTTERNLGREEIKWSDIQKAQQYYLEHFHKVLFIVLSDEMAWCNRTIKGNVAFSPFTDPGDDMALMAQCDHVIVTAGTFGWWGAWLSGGTTLYFKGFLRPNSAFGRSLNRADYIPSEWIPY